MLRNITDTMCLLFMLVGPAVTVLVLAYFLGE